MTKNIKVDVIGAGMMGKNLQKSERRRIGRRL